MLLTRKEMALLFRKTTRTIANWEADGLVTNRGLKGKHPLYDPRDIYIDITDEEILAVIKKKES